MILLFAFVPEVDVHFPVAAVEVAVVEFKLEGASVPDVTVTLGGGEGVLRPALDDPSTLVLVAIPHHQAAGGEAAADQLNSLVDMSTFIPVKESLNNCTISCVHIKDENTFPLSSGASEKVQRSA